MNENFEKAREELKNALDNAGYDKRADISIRQEGPDLVATLAPKAGEEVCDFCCEPSRPLHTFSCTDFESGPLDFGSIVIGTSVGDWAACDECKKLIEDDDFEKLADRAASKIFAHQNYSQEEYEMRRGFLVELHAEFRHRNRKLS